MTASLVVVGVGIRTPGHVTEEAKQAIERAAKVLFLVADPVAEEWIRRTNPEAETLVDCYRPGESRSVAYAEMVDRILSSLRAGKAVCAVFYGHPGVFVQPSHEAVRAARKEGFPATMLPGISAEDCLFADLGIDPAESGCQSFEATDFLASERGFDPHSVLILWQVGVIGVSQFDPNGSAKGDIGVDQLVERLVPIYGSGHEVILYEASPYLVAPPMIRRQSLEQLRSVPVPPIATLFVPPVDSQSP